MANRKISEHDAATSCTHASDYILANVSGVTKKMLLSNVLKWTGVSGNFVSFDASGNLQDSGKKHADYAAAGHNHDGSYSAIGHSHAAYANKVGSPTTGNLASLTAGGDLADSGSKAADFATAGHNHSGVYSPVGHDHSGVYQPVMGADDNYVTDAEKIVIGNTSGTNSGNETATSIGAIINGATADTTPLDADKFTFWDAVDSALKAVTWANVKATLKAYFDGIYHALGLNTLYTQVRAATTANITIATALNNGDTLDGITLATGDRVLVKDQSSGAENGIYIVGASPARATDYDSDAEIRQSMVLVQEGTANAGRFYQNTNTAAITVDSTAITYAFGINNKIPETIVTDHGYVGSTDSITIGETVAFGQLCSLHTDGKMYLVDANTAAASSGDGRRLLRMCVVGGNANDTGTFLRPGGQLRDDSFTAMAVSTSPKMRVVASIPVGPMKCESRDAARKAR